MRYFTSPAERDLALEAWSHARALARVSGSVGARVTHGEPGQEVHRTPRGRDGRRRPVTGQDPRHDRDWIVGVALCWVGVLLATAYLLAQILRWIF